MLIILPQQRMHATAWCRVTLSAIGAGKRQEIVAYESMKRFAIPTYGRDSFSKLRELTVNAQADQGTPMDPRLPSSRSLIGSTSTTWQAHVASISFQDGISEGFCSTSALVRCMRIPPVKGSGIQWYPLPSTPFPQGVFSLMISSSFSDLTSHIAVFFVCSSQLLLWAFSEFFSQRPQESQSHPSQSDTRYAMSYSRHRSEVRGTLHRPLASDASVAKTDSRPYATCATGNLLRSSPGLRMEASLSLHEAKQGVCSPFSIGTIYVTYDIKANAPYVRFAAPTADNSGDHDARVLYTIELAQCRAHYGTPLTDARHCVIAADVMRHLRNRFV